MQCSLQDYLLAIKEDAYIKDFPELREIKFIKNDGVYDSILLVNNRQIS